MNISFITTVRHNVGDDFIREGLKYLLRKFYKGRKISFSNIHKHSPITSRYGFERVRNLSTSIKWDKKLPIWITPDRIMKADLLIQSGAPVYWYHPPKNMSVRNEWYVPLIKQRFVKNKNAKLLNLAAGTCQRYNSDGTEFLESKENIDYMKEFFELSKVTTFRDELSKKIFKMLGYDAPVIPCSSIFASDETKIYDSGNDYVVVNYMEGGGHFTFGQDIDAEKWKREFKKFYDVIKKNENIIFSCHNEKEISDSKEIDPDAKIFFSNDYKEYLKFYSKAKSGILNRIHAAFIVSSFGKPSIIVGTDTRAKMAGEIGLKSIFVNDADSEFLLSEYEKMKTGYDNYAERFRVIKEKAFKDYMNAFSKID